MASALAELTVHAVLVAPDPGTLRSKRVDELEVDLGGVLGDRHYGLTRLSGNRESACYPRGTEIRNRRQVSLLSVEECADTATRMGIPELLPEWLGGNIVVGGMPEFSALGAGTRLRFPTGAVLVCEGVNQPCRFPGEIIQAEHPDRPGMVAAFVREAFGRRGVVASVEHPGRILPGERCRIHPAELHRTLT